MCNACGFQCCASDEFEGCGCDDCDDPACWSRCEYCGQSVTGECDCQLSDWYEDCSYAA